ATLLTKVMERFPIIITIGAALLGFLAGEMLLTDPAMTQQFGKISEQNVLFAGILGAVLVVILGTWLQKRSKIKDK
ncbi:MAG: TerC family protein, partial [Polaromonas sp.]|nr:TerC family protein [Polaromonas sp.]